MYEARVEAVKNKFAKFPHILEWIETDGVDIAAPTIVGTDPGPDGIPVPRYGESALERLERLDPDSEFARELDVFCKEVVLEGARRVARGEPWHG
jgi:hypothetical protein